jgi:DNA-binding response OmpR family regulator
LSTQCAFTNNELLARAEALLRRAGKKDGAKNDLSEVYDDGLVRIDRRARSVHVTTPEGEQEARLTSMEFRLLNVGCPASSAALPAVISRS